MPGRYEARRQELAAALRHLRARTGLSGDTFAQLLGDGWWQTRVSKIERGAQLPSEADVAAWAAAAGAPEEAGRLTGLLRAARGEREEFRRAYSRAGGAAERQAGYGEVERQAARIRQFQLAMVPGLLMTAGYAEGVLRSPAGPLALGTSEDEIGPLLTERLQRQDILSRRDKRVEIVVLEAALYTRLAEDPAVMLGQLDRLLALEGMPALELTIVPFTAAVPVLPLTGFTVFDDDQVLIETLTSDEPIGDPDDVARYIAWFGLLRDAGVRGRETAQLILRARASFREAG